MKRLYTGGTFDLFHASHVDFLKFCKALADKVIVSLNTDEFIEAYKGVAPVIPYEERKRVLLGCRYVDEVVCNEGGADSKIAIEKVQPQIIAVGSDWATRDYYSQMGFTQEWLNDKGIVLVYLPYGNGTCTTEIKLRIKCLS